MGTANTMDQKIVERAAAKRKLEKMIKSQDKAGLTATMEAISPQELMDLLNSKDHAGVIDRKDGPIFGQDELDQLLDRSDLSWEKLRNLANNKENETISKQKNNKNIKKEKSQPEF